MENKTMPEIRFPGYTEDWGLRRFKGFISKAGKKNTSGENYSPFSVSNKVGLVSQSEQFDRSRLDNLDKKSYKLVYPNEFVYNPARINVGSIAFNNLNKTVIVSSLYVVLKISEKLDNDFIIQYIKTQPFINEVKRNTEGSVREYLFFDSFSNVKFPYTANKSEQIKIGSFFNEFDDKIVIQEQELDTLKQTKQGFLQKMFPKEGESVPEIRFPGFTGDWVQRKLIEVVDFFNEKRIPIDSKKRVKGNYPYYGATGIIDYVEDYIFEGEYVLLAEDGANILARSNPIAYLTQGNFWVNNHAHIMKMKSGSNVYLLQLLERQNYEKYNSGTAQPKLNGEVVKNITFNFPSDEEQTKIGNFFKQLDDTIALHEQELETLKQTKKAFLQKMFV